MTQRRQEWRKKHPTPESKDKKSMTTLHGDAVMHLLFFLFCDAEVEAFAKSNCQGCKLVVFQEGINRKKGRFCQTSSLSFGNRRVLSKVFLCCFL